MSRRCEAASGASRASLLSARLKTVRPRIVCRRCRIRSHLCLHRGRIIETGADRGVLQAPYPVLADACGGVARDAFRNTFVSGALRVRFGTFTPLAPGILLW